MEAAPPNWAGRLAAAWAVAGVLALLGSAIARLTPLALEALAGPLRWQQWAFLLPWTVFMAWSEGYRGFQRGFSPRVVVRAAALLRNPRPLHVLLAPAIAMGWLHGTRRRLIVARSMTLGIAGLVVIVRALPQPWRGLVDGGVVLGLAWGAIAILVFAARALGGRPPAVAADLPGQDQGVPPPCPTAPGAAGW